MASCQLLTNTYKEIYQNIPISLLNLIMRNFTMNFILYTHFFVIIFPLYFYLYDFKLFNILLYFFGLVLFSINTILISYLCCMITTRYRDFYPLIQAILSAATLLTPIIWNKEMLGSKMEYVYLNPLSFMIEIVRDPIIDKIPDFKVYIYNFSLILVLYLLLITVIKLKGKRIIFGFKFMTSISIKNVNLSFPKTYNKSMRAELIDKIIKKNNNFSFYSALKNINLTIKEGDKIGLVGSNGSGKTSLLKILAGIYYPNSGEISVDGSISTLIALTTGLDLEMNGLENIYLSSYLRGF